jgi:hypothetical protein
MTVITLPRREELCWTLLVASSLASKTAVSARGSSASCRRTNSRTTHTWSGRHGTVSHASANPSTAAQTTGTGVLVPVIVHRPVGVVGAAWQYQAGSR